MFEAAVKAVECTDTCMGRIVEALDKVGGEAPDHRRPRQCRADGRRVHRPGRTPRTPANRCPSSYVGKRKLSIREGGVLADVAPTMLTLMGLEQPAEMTGRSIVTLG